MPDTLDKPPVRYCHGCQTYDDHPRVTVAVDLDAANDRLYHYDCLPAEHKTPELAAIVDERESGGAHGHELQRFATDHARSLTEAPADRKGK